MNAIKKINLNYVKDEKKQYLLKIMMNILKIISAMNSKKIAIDVLCVMRIYHYLKMDFIFILLKNI